ncbi:MAG: zinc ABC transporter substrate-binding protein [Clostridiales bacterium]|nr:zinc ABC transporter substrate-binding protein [Clostridiales bacterium]
MNKRILVLLMSLVMCVSLLGGCGSRNTLVKDYGNEKLTEGHEGGESESYSVVCTIFPEYDWVREIIGDTGADYELTLLLDNGVDLHSYQPTAEDIAKIADCDLFIYVGGESDEWVEDALKEARNENMQIINLLTLLGDDIKEEEIVEGMESGHEHENGEELVEEEEQEEHSHEPEYDEHVWLSLKNVQNIVPAIAEALGEADSRNADSYRKNAADYCARLSALDQEYESMAENAKIKTIVFGDRFPFRYLADDYGLDYYAAFAGCSAETEADFETITFLADKVDELELNSIFTIENSDQRVARTIVENTQNKNQDILVLNSLQSVTGKDVEKGVSYLQMMQENLEVLKKALN